MEKYLDATLKPEERAEDLLSKLSLEEKFAQVSGMYAFPLTMLPPGTADHMKEAFKNGVGQMSCLFMRTFHDVHEALELQRTYQKMIVENSIHHIPAIFHMEGLTGSMLLGATGFPANINRGASFDPELEEEIGRITARQELPAGITQILCPVLDVNRDPRLGRVGETYGEDPTLAAAMGAAMTKGLQETVVEGRRADACAKHFMGFHTSEGGIHGASTYIGDRTLLEVFGKPFQAAIAESGLKAVMPCYDSMDGEPASASLHLLTDLLRDEMGFEGAAISDYGAVGNIHIVQGVEESMAEAGYRSLAAGMDCELPMKDAFNDEMLEMFRDGRADIKVLDQAVLRELTAKFRMGLFEHPYALSDEDFDRVFSDGTEQEVSLRSARESLILLKNDGTLPLKKGLKKIALIGPHADWANHYFGGYTQFTFVEGLFAARNSMAGIMADNAASEVKYIPGTRVEFSETDKFRKVMDWAKPGIDSILKKLREDLPDTEITYAHGYQVAGADESEFAEALAACEGADVILLTLGGKHGTSSIATMGEGVDSTDINLPRCQDRFIEEASKLGIPMVGIHIDGRPVSSDAADEKLAALIECFSPSECTAQAVSEVLRGEVNPSGKLPLSVAFSAGQLPVYYNHPNGSAWHQGMSIGFQNYVDCPHYPRYFFGHGLSYTKFEYSNLTVNGVLQQEEETLGGEEKIRLRSEFGQSLGETANLPEEAKEYFKKISQENPLPEDRIPSVGPEEKISISLTLKNTGDVSGTEVVQLYLRDKFASMTRPNQELIGFKRVTLAPGEAKKVVFTVDPSVMAFLTRDMKWKVEKGRFDVLIGSSSADLRLVGAYMVNADRFLEGKKRSFYAEAEVL